MNRQWISFVYLSFVVALVYSHRHHYVNQRKKILGALVGDRIKTPLQFMTNDSTDSSPSKHLLYPAVSNRNQNVRELRFGSPVIILSLLSLSIITEILSIISSNFHKNVPNINRY